jgi:hypothetical protein
VSGLESETDVFFTSNTILMLTFKEKKLYHQIHPLKLATDISVSIVTTYLLWHHNIFWFLIFCLAPSVIASLLIIRFVSLKNLKESSLGKYIEKYMTSTIEAMRMMGQIIVWIAAWYHLPFIMVIGYLIVIAAWCRGILFKRQ